MNTKKFFHFIAISLLIVASAFSIKVSAQSPDARIRNEGTPYERRAILSAHDWCYELEGSSITFYPVVLNYGYSPWTPQGEGFYGMIIGYYDGRVSSEYNYRSPSSRYSLPRSWRLGSLSKDKLPVGRTVPFNFNWTYYIGNWEISYPNIDKKNRVYSASVKLSGEGFTGGQLRNSGLMNRYMCRSMNLMSK